MRISVVIPAYNSVSTIRETLDSVLAQTVQPDEILVMDDGSTDDTPRLLASYAPRVTTLRQENQGVAAARNALCARATGDLVAFLDQDDLWHPCYLGHRLRLFARYPDAVAFFAGHIDFFGYGDHAWERLQFDPEAGVEVLNPLSFFKKLVASSCLFFPSFLCVPKDVLAGMGAEPFPKELSGVDDGYFTRRLPLLGHVVFAPAALVAYRVHEGQQSRDRLQAMELMVECYDLLDGHYEPRRGTELFGAFRMAFASQERQYAKALMGAGRATEARLQLRSSLGTCADAVSTAKSLGLLSLTYLPSALQPEWPPAYREWAGSAHP